MIIDTLDNLGKYVSLNPLYADVVEFLKNNDLYTMEEGKYPIKGDELFVNITTVNAKTKDEAKLETHRKMIDIQIPLAGPEQYGYTPLSCLPEVEYNEQKDISFYAGLAESYVGAKPGMFCIFEPQDGHAPGITPVPLRKAIFKVKA